MNYERHYGLLIERAKARTLEGHSELHHIKPSCLGGGDEAYRSKLIGRSRSEESVAKIKLGMASQPLRICPHCGKEGKGGNMTRFHFENCASLTLLKGAVTDDKS